MDARKEIFRLLKQHRVDLVRRGKHEIYRLPGGKMFVTGRTRTDERGWRNRLAKLRKLLGIAPPDNGAAPGRKKLLALGGKKRPMAQLDFTAPETPPKLHSLAEQLKDALRDWNRLGTKRP